MLIRLLLIVGALLIVFLLIRRRHGARTKAWARILLVLFLAAFIIAVLRPEYTSMAAELVGVGRGTDLLLYGVTVALLYVATALYLRLRDLQGAITVLARRVAIAEARAAHPPAEAAGDAGGTGS